MNHCTTFKACATIAGCFILALPAMPAHSAENPYADYSAPQGSGDKPYAGVIKEFGTAGTYGTEENPAPPREDTSTPDEGSPDDSDNGNEGSPDDPGNGDDGNTGGDEDTDDGGSDGEDSPPEQSPSEGNGSVPNVDQGAIVSFEVKSIGDEDAASEPVTIGQVFARGAVRSGNSVVAVVDNKRIPTQVDTKATWSDGSLRHAVISVRMPAESGESTIVGLVPVDTPDQGSAISVSELLGTSFDATAELKIRGRSYSVSARDLLAQVSQVDGCSPWGKQCKQWLSGPIASEWIIGGPLSQGDGQADLAGVYFHVRAYRDERGVISQARVDTVIENSRAYPDTTRNLQYNATIKVGRHETRETGLKHYRQARWHKVLWWKDDPAVYARSDVRYLQDSRAVSRYEELKPTNKFLSSRPSSFEPMTNGDQTKRMGNGGAQQAIGPLPRWTSTYVVSGDERAFDWMLANDDAVGTYGFHYRDDQTGRPLEITRHPYVTIANRSYAARAEDPRFEEDLLPSCQGDCNSPYVFDISHHPSIGYVPYLVTGDYYYLEEMQFAASYMQLWANQKYRELDKGVLRGAQGQVRGQAWALRSMADAAFATPDRDPLKSYFNGLMDHILTDYQDAYLADESASPLHVINDYGAVIYGFDGQSRVGIAPWQQDFFLWSVGHAAELGFDKAEPFMKWLSEFSIGRMTDWQSDSDDGFCWIVASAYQLKIRDTRRGADYSSLDEVYRNSEPEIQGLSCNSQAMANRLSNGARQYVVGEMVGYAHSSTGFPSNFQPALATAASSGLKNASEAWRLFADRPIKPNYRNYANFAVVPR